MKIFSSAWIAKLNAQHSGGKFLKAVVLQENVTRYYVHHEQTIIFNGNTYEPLPMQWEGVELNASMQLPGIRITVPNLLGQITDFLETQDILGNDVTLQILHLDLLGTVTDVDSMALQVLTIDGNLDAVTFTLGINLGLNDLLPKGLVTRKEFPGVPDDLRRVSILG